MYCALSENLRIKLADILNHYPRVVTIVKTINDAQGRALLVGGAVRDLILGLEVKDIDIEVHGIPIESLERLLKQFGTVSLVGKSFGVLRLHGLDVDWSLPRTDEQGRKPKVTLDPNLSMQEAFRRRDLTMNAMGIDLITFQLIDPFNGMQDINNKILRTPDKNFFVEDPLRFYRVMQFISRFEMFPDQDLNEICTTMDITHISSERIEAEFQKLLLRSRQPSLGIRWLASINRIKQVLPEIAATIGIAQEAEWHPEGDVFEHSMQTLDAAASLDYDDMNTKLIVTWASLCHDIGKVSTTLVIDGRIKSPGHAPAGARLAARLLKRITRNKDLIIAVEKLVRYHMQPIQMVLAGSTLAAYKRLAKKLAPEATIAMMTHLILADRWGRNPESHKPLRQKEPEVDQFLARVQEANVLYTVEQPVLLGRDLLDTIKPGPEMGNLLKEAYEIQINENITDKDVLKRRVLEKKGD